LLQVQIALEIAKNLIVDAALLAKTQKGSTLHTQHVMGQRPVFVIVQGPRRDPAILCRVGGRQSLDLFAVMLREIVVHARIFGAIMAARFFKR
jgi:hypothetical protein